MRHFVRHNSGELGFVCGGGDGADINEHRPAGKGKGVDFFLRDHVKLERPGILRGDGGDEFLSELAYVLRLGAGVGQHGHLLVHLRGGLQAELALLVARYAGIAGIGKLGPGSHRRELGDDEQQRQTSTKADLSTREFVMAILPR